MLGKAEEFRTTFKVQKLKAPTWLYYSQIWLVPSEAGYRAPHISPPSQWAMVWGDGRVPAVSALVADNPTVFSYRKGLSSVHGNLPADPDFYDDFFRKRLPDIFNATLAVGMLKDALSKADWIRAYSKLPDTGPDSAQFQAIMEPLAAKGSESESLLASIATVRSFNQRLCAQRAGCAQSYGKAKLLTAAADTSKMTKLMQYGSVARSMSRSHPDYAYAEGNRGLVLAKSTEWSAASVSLSKARESISEIQADASEVGFKVDSNFVNVIDANLGKSLYEAGQCQAAEPYLRKSVDHWSFAKVALAKPCNDEPSGLQYCFDVHDYCRKAR